MEEEREGKLNNLLLIILNIVIISVVAICCSFILLVNKVYATTLTPTAMQCSWNTSANGISTQNCLSGNDYNIGGYTNYVNFLPTFNSNYGNRLWTIDFFLDMYVVDYGNEGDYIVTPNFTFYKNNVAQNITNLARIIESQRADCSNQAGCMLIRTFHFSFQWQGDINGITIQNLASASGRGDCGWLQDAPTTCQASYPRIHYLQMTASFADTTDQTIQNSTNTIINNNNQNTQSIIENQNSNADRIIDSNTTSAQSVINADNYNTDRIIDSLEGNTQANQTMYDDTKQEEYLEKEEELLDLYNTDQLDIIDLTIDTNGSNWVWDRITQFLNTNQYIRLMFISVLSLGIVKLVLAR